MNRRRNPGPGPSSTRLMILAAVLMLISAACAEESPQAPTTTQITMTMDDPDDAAGMDHSDDIADTDHSDGMEDGHDHEHDEEGREWEGTPPILDLRIEEGPDGAIAVLDASGFSFIDPSSDEHVPGFGHTHVLVDGLLLGMSYEAAVPLGELEPGVHHIEVTLASGDHADFLVDGEVLGAAAMIEVAGEVQAPDLEIPIGFAGGAIDIADDRFEIARHSIVEIIITSDVAEEVHVHGYNLARDIEAGTSTSVRFTADIPGVFEVELEDSGHLLFELTVTP